MKVVLFCGGESLRLPDAAEPIPKPMVRIGYRPILWHVMRTYATFGYREFILCLGRRGDMIKDYFLHYEEAMSNDFILSDGGRQVELLGSDIVDWSITFADTGGSATIADRLLAVRHHLASEEIFLANYGDILTDADLSSLVGDFAARTATAGMLVVRPQQSFHMVDSDNGRVSGLRDARDADLWINGGYYMFRQGIFDVTRRGEELVDEPFARLIEAGQLVAYRHDGFHASLETLKDLERLQLLGDAGRLPSARRSVASAADPVIPTAEMDLATAGMDLGEGDQLG